MDAKQKKLYDFYVQCTEKGYSDMQDATQSLKAKVIATDLEIPYKDISQTYEQAKLVYEEEVRRIEHEEMLQNTSGELLVRLEGNEDKSLSVYRREDGSIYCTFNKQRKKHEGVPRVYVKHGNTVTYDYTPSKAVYTGASSGGVTMGGVHYTQAYVTPYFSETGKADVEVSAFGETFKLKFIKLSDSIAKKFRRDEWVKSHLKNKTIECFNSAGSKESARLVNLAMTAAAGGDHYKFMSIMTKAADEERLSGSACRMIVDFLNAVFEGNYPEDDESIYHRALAMESADTSGKIKECVALFCKIEDYKDAAERARIQQTRYEEVLQREKEEAILRKEAEEAAREANRIAQAEKDALFRKKLKKVMPFFIILALVLAFAAVTIGIPAMNEMQLANQYERAVGMLSNGQYEEAMILIESLGDYQGAENLMQEAKTQKKEAMYQEALRLWEQEGDDTDYAEASFRGYYNKIKALKLFDEILKDGEYKDCSNYRLYWDNYFGDLDDCILAFEQLPLDFMDVEQRLNYMYELRKLEGKYKATKSKTYKSDEGVWTVVNANVEVTLNETGGGSFTRSSQAQVHLNLEWKLNSGKRTVKVSDVCHYPYDSYIENGKLPNMKTLYVWVDDVDHIRVWYEDIYIDDYMTFKKVK